MRRREFLGKTLIGTTGMALGASGLLTASCKGANDKVVLAIIGSGGRGLPAIISCCQVNTNVEIKTVCDVNDLRSTRAVSEIEKQLGYKPQITRNMKEVFDDRDVDAVWVSTPDHWHALATIWACQAGKDVYIEKPVSKTVEEGRAMINAAKNSKQIVTVGLNRRAAPTFQSLAKEIPAGKIGKVTFASACYVSNMFPVGIGKMKPENPPKDFNWDEWLGPRAYRPYPIRCRLLMSSSGALMTINILEASSGSFVPYGFIELRGTKGTLQTGENDYKILPTRPGQFQSWDNLMEAETVNLETKDRLLTDGRYRDSTANHIRNFLDCVKSRQTPFCTLEEGHRSASLAHLATIALVTKERLQWNAKTEKFTNSEKANQLLGYEYRKPWKL